ncbi:zf-HC2 domain-containing protein [Streptacidiphilus sp. EB129]|uniref:zf-HC2 domain-containing protein n=1 Tax=Streptacidiphilus sp. EB129 TaxID=3156262 RepID=UPI00351210D3
MVYGEHARLREALGGYLLGALSSEQDELMARHLAVCPDCEQELIAMVDTAAAFTLLGDPPPRRPSPRN